MLQSTVYENEQLSWSRRAADYDEVFAHISTQAIQPILDSLGDLKGKRLLDIACGTGHLVHAAEQRGAISEGTDLAAEMIATAMQNYPQHPFQQSDATCLPFEDDTFDAVTCSFGLSHMVTPLDAMREAFRVLKPGGQFAFTLWYGDSDRSEQTALVQAALKKHGDSPLDLTNPHYPLRYADEQACRALTRKAGFHSPAFQDITSVAQAKTGQQVYDLIDRISVRTKRAIDNQSPKAQKKIREAVITGAETYRKNGQISLRWDAQLTTVQKPMPSEVEKSALSAKYSLFESVDEMLAPTALSELLGRPVSGSVCTPMEDHNGLSGARLQYVETNAGRLVLKRMSPEHDFLMNITQDRECRSVTLWQYGLLDELYPQSEHHILAAARDGDGWALLLEDVGPVFYAWDNTPPREHIDAFLDSLAGIHAAFWDDDRLRAPELGLMTPQIQLDMAIEGTRLGLASADQSLGPLPEWFRIGWHAMDELLDSETAASLKKLIQDPKPIREALNRYPTTLVHGDYRSSNLGYIDQPIIIDWQQPAHTLMTIDLIWFLESDSIETILKGEDRNTAIAYYRSRLETYLGFQIEEKAWQAMLRIGSAIHAFRVILFKGFFYTVGDDPEWQAKDRVWIQEKARMLLSPETWA